MERFVLITRPKVDAVEIADKISAKGHKVHCEPLIDISYHQERFSLSTEDYAGLIFTSVNGVRAFAQNCDDRDLPVWTVGNRTMAEVREIGFSDVTSAEGAVDDLMSLLAQRPAEKPYLYIRGRDIAKPLANAVVGVRIDEKTLYHIDKKEKISNKGFDLLKSGQITDVLFFSQRTAEAFVAYLQKHDLVEAVTSAKALCLGTPMVQYLSVLPWQDIQVASHPDRKAMIALLDK